MRIEEDHDARIGKVRAGIREVKQGGRRPFLISIPLFVAAGIFMGFAEPDRVRYAFLAVFIPPILAGTFLLTCWMPLLFKHRWVLSNKGILIRGEAWGRIQWSKIKSWEFEDITELPGHVHLKVFDHPRIPTGIIVSKSRFPISSIEAFLQSKVITEQGEGGNSE